MRKKGFKLMTSPYDEISLKDSLKYIDGIKIGSGDIDNDPILDVEFKTKLPIYIATGASDFKDIQVTMNKFEKLEVIFLIFR